MKSLADHPQGDPQGGQIQTREQIVASADRGLKTVNFMSRRDAPQRQVLANAIADAAMVSQLDATQTGELIRQVEAELQKMATYSEQFPPVEAVQVMVSFLVTGRSDHFFTAVPSEARDSVLKSIPAIAAELKTGGAKAE